MMKTDASNLIYMKPFIYTCFFCLITYAASVEAATPVTERYIALAIRGDLRPVAELLDRPRFHGEAVAAGWAEGFRARFLDSRPDRSPGSGDPLADRIVSAYRDYWAKRLMAPERDNEHLRQLEANLQATAGTGPGNVEERLAQALAARGFHALFTPAPPLRDLFAWRAEHRRNYLVELTDGRRAVNVVFMNDFVSLGWKDYATLGLASTTGWVEDGVLWCVEWAYLPGSENFEVSYLKHEARHLADLERFPGLTSVELEYRAKLTELAFATSTLYRVLDDFTLKRAPTPGAPHAQANDRVVLDLYRRLFEQHAPSSQPDWRRAAGGRINGAARALLAEDTRRLESRAAHPAPAM